MTYYVYIMTNRRHGTLYIGVTNDVVRRAWEHREGLVAGFTKTYGLKLLVYVEEFADIAQAIHREKRLKHWKRDWKITLIENPIPNGMTSFRRSRKWRLVLRSALRAAEG